MRNIGHLKYLKILQVIKEDLNKKKHIIFLTKTTEHYKDVGSH